MIAWPSMCCPLTRAKVGNFDARPGEESTISGFHIVIMVVSCLDVAFCAIGCIEVLNNRMLRPAVEITPSSRRFELVLLMDKNTDDSLAVHVLPFISRKSWKFRCSAW